jgi:cytochrome c-type biogenesis protein
MPLGLLAVFFAGLLTLATPCVLPMIPVYLAMVAGASSAAADRRGRSKTVLAGATLFVGGFASVFTLLGMAATSVGAALASHRTVLLLVAGALMVVFGLKELSILKLGWLDRTLALPSVKTKHAAFNAFGLGVVFALGWTPCVGPILAGVLTFTASHTASPGEGALYLFVYALGVGLPLLGFAWLGDRALGAARRFSRQLPVVERVTGVLLLVGGLATALPAARTVLLSHRGNGSDPALTELAAHAGRPLLLAFHSPSCPVCRKMAPRVADLERDCVGKQMDVVRVNVARPEGLRLATRFGVVQVPTFLFLGADHSSEAVLVGEHAVDDLRAAATRLLRAACGAVAPSTTTSDAKVSVPRAPEASQASCSTIPGAEAGAQSLSCSG